MSGDSWRILIGFAIMAATCSASFALGDRPVRRMALLIGFTWMALVLVQLATARSAEPAIAAEVIGALITLAWAWNGGRVWLWGMVGIQSCLLLLHAVLYTVGWQATPLEVLANNVLSTGALALLLIAAILSRHAKADPVAETML